MAQHLDDAAPTLEERYGTATVSSNLRVQADIPGDGDVLIAVGWSASRLGAALMRLHTEFDCASKTKSHDSRARLAALAAEGRGVQRTYLDNGVMKPTPQYEAKCMIEALKTASGWEKDANATLMSSLKTLPHIKEQVALQAASWGIERPAEVALAVIAHWLDKNCHTCEGRKFQLIPGTPSLSAKHCKSCQGTGESPLRYGHSAKRLTGFMDDCVNRAQHSIRKRLRSI